MDSFIPLLSYDVTVELQSTPSSSGRELPTKDSELKAENGKGMDYKDQGTLSVSKNKKPGGKKKKKSNSHANMPSKASGLAASNQKAKDECSDATVVVNAKGIGHAVHELKKAIYNVQTALYNGPCSISQMQTAAEFLIQSEYADIVTERSLVKNCGLPTCKNLLPDEKSRKGKYRISLREHKVYDVQESRLFCSAACLIESRKYCAMLRTSRDDDIEQQKLRDIVRRVSALDLDEGKYSGIRELGIEAKETVAHFRNNLDNCGTFRDTGPSYAIEGYVPERLHGHSRFSDSGGSSFSTDEQRNISYVDQENVGLIAGAENRVDKGPEKGSHNNSKLNSAVKQACKKPHRVSWLDMKEQEGSNSIDVATNSIINDSFTRQSSLHCHGATVVPHIEDETQTNNALNSRADIVKEEKLEIAEEFASALTAAAIASETGEVNSSEAAAQAGLCILPCSERFDHISCVNENALKNFQDNNKPEWFSEADAEPNGSMTVWYDAVPKGFKAEISGFCKIWEALNDWVSAATVAYLYGGEEDEERFVFMVGREYSRQRMILDGASGEILHTLAGFISRVLPDVTRELQLSVPISAMEQALGRLLRTMSFTEALPALGISQWKMVVILFLDALSVQRLPALEPQFRQNRELLQQVLLSLGTSDVEFQTFRDFILPLGRLPMFSMKGGG